MIYGLLFHYSDGRVTVRERHVEGEEVSPALELRFGQPMWQAGLSWKKQKGHVEGKERGGGQLEKMLTVLDGDR